MTIFDAGQVRQFSPVGDGTYQGAPGDYGTLSLAGGAYQLREKDGTVTAFLPDGQLNYMQDPDGNQIRAGYTAGLLTSLTHSDGDSLTIAYNAQGRISQVTDSAGRATTYTYDAAGEHLQSVTNPAGTTQYTYINGANIEQEHALQSITYTDGTHSYFSYDALGRLSQESGDNGAGQLTFTYFSPGGYTVTDANGATTKILYDVNGNPAQITDPLGNVSQVRYDSNGQPTLIGLVGGPSESLKYDEEGNVDRVVDPLGNTSQFAYNPLFSSLQDYKDTLGNLTSYQQDNQGNPLGIIYADDSSIQDTPDAQGDIAQTVDARGQAIANTYNSRGQVVDQTFSDGTHNEFTYDSHGNLATATDAAGTTRLYYDNADRLTKITYPSGQFLEYTYDSGGRRSSMTDQTGFTENYQYDAEGQLAGMTDGQGNLVVHYDYDAAGQLVREDMGNGTYTTYAYDLAGNLTSLINFAPGGSVNSRFDYTYNAEGLQTSMTTLQGTTTYGYDAAGELTSADLPGGPIITYAYDAMGNRTVVSDSGATTDYTTNDLNQYTSAGDTTYAYDAAGNLTVATGPGGGTIYTYDSEDRLIGVQTATDTWTYQYDALGDRIAATHNGQTIQYLVDPLGQNAVVGEFGGSGNLLAHYTQGLGLTSQVDASNNATFYNFDASGNTVGLSGSTGSYLNSYSYLPFGGILSSTETVPNPFQFDGLNGVMSQGNGLDMMAARFYDPTTGRFLSRDPIGVAGGGNIYAYAKNNPLSSVDPSGLATYVVAPAEFIAEWTATAARLAAESAADVLSQGGTAAEAAAEQAFVEQSVLSTATSTWFETQATAYFEAECVANGGVPLALADTQAVAVSAEAGAAAAGEATAVGGVALFATAAAITAALAGLGLAGWQAYELYQDLHPAVYTIIDGQTVAVTQESPIDPNFISGPSGYGSQGFVGPETPLPYEIAFENEPNAAVPAQVVTVTQQLDPNLDWSTFQLGSFGFGGQTYSVPAGRQFYSTRIDARSKVGVYVDVTASFDQQTGIVTWTFTSIDPTTLDQPTGDVLEGFLPPDKTAPQGQGWVSYFVQPKATDPTGTLIHAQASVVFDSNAPIDTQPFVNTIDSGAPTSGVGPLPPSSPAKFTVTWGGKDDPDGSGIDYFDVYVSDDGGPFTPWQSATTQTSAVFTGQDGHTYGFYSVATDNVGNPQEMPTLAQATTTVDALSPTSRVSPLPATQITPSFTVSWSGADNAGGSGIASYSIYVSDDGGPFTEFLAGTTNTSATFTGQIGHTYGFYSVATDNVGNVQATPTAAEATTTIVMALTSITPASPSAKHARWGDRRRLQRTDPAQHLHELGLAADRQRRAQPDLRCSDHFAGLRLDLSDRRALGFNCEQRRIYPHGERRGYHGFERQRGHQLSRDFVAHGRDAAHQQDRAPGHPASGLHVPGLRHRVRRRLTTLGRPIVRHLGIDQRGPVDVLDERAGE